MGGCPYSKVEGNLLALLFGPDVEAGLLVSSDVVGEGRSIDGLGGEGQQGHDGDQGHGCPRREECHDEGVKTDQMRLEKVEDGE